MAYMAYDRSLGHGLHRSPTHNLNRSPTHNLNRSPTHNLNNLVTFKCQRVRALVANSVYHTPSSCPNPNPTIVALGKAYTGARPTT